MLILSQSFHCFKASSLCDIGPVLSGKYAAVIHVSVTNQYKILGPGGVYELSEVLNYFKVICCIN